MTTFKQWFMKNHIMTNNRLTEIVSSDLFPDTIDYDDMFLFLAEQEVSGDEVAFFYMLYKAYKRKVRMHIQGELKNPEYNKVHECVFAYKEGCKGCEFNEVPDLRDGGCNLTKTIDEHIDYIIKLKEAERSYHKKKREAEQKASPDRYPMLKSIGQIMEEAEADRFTLQGALSYQLQAYLKKLSYSSLWRLEVCMMVGSDIYDLNKLSGCTYEELEGKIDIDGSLMELSDLEALAKAYHVPTSIDDGGNKTTLIEYVIGKRYLGQFLESYREALNFLNPEEEKGVAS